MNSLQHRNPKKAKVKAAQSITLSPESLNWGRNAAPTNWLRIAYAARFTKPDFLVFDEIPCTCVFHRLRRKKGYREFSISLPNFSNFGKNPKLESIDKWLTAFGNYASIAVEKFPHKGSQFFAYQRIMREAGLAL